jgi:MoaA/NifB/PqqE/SkfB family radical SAM enzyme
LYRAVRGVTALTAIERGVARLQRLAPSVPITARATLHRMNFRELPRLIDHAKAMALDGISFLPADVSSAAFGRAFPTRSEALSLDAEETGEFAELIEETVVDHRDDFASGFVAESPDKLRRLPQYYAALGGRATFPSVSCNAPYMSAVIEADGSVRPCFFHQTVGSVRLEPLASIVKRNLPAFRENLTIESNPVCTRCVCSMKTGWRNAPWQ